MAVNIIVPGRFSYLNLWKPRVMEDGKPPKFSVTVLIPKKDTKTVAAIHAAEEKCKVEYATKLGKAAKTATCLKDGNLPKKDGEDRGPEYKDHWYITATASEDRQPDAVNKNREPIINKTDIKSGDYGFVSLNLFGFDTGGNKGISAGFQNIMKVIDGPSLGGSQSAEDDFADVDTSYFGDIDDTVGTGATNNGGDDDDW